MLHCSICGLFLKECPKFHIRDMEIYSIDVISQLEELKFGFGYCENGINSISIVMKVSMTHC